MHVTPDTPARLGVMPDPPAHLTPGVQEATQVASGRLADMLDQIWDVRENERPRVYLIIDGEGVVRRWDRIQELLNRSDLAQE